jgi:hypothetical protein
MSDDKDLEDLEDEIGTELTGKPGAASARVTRSQWEECCVLWQSGKSDIKDLARRYSIQLNTLRRRFKNAGAVKGSRFTPYRQGEYPALQGGAEHTAVSKANVSWAAVAAAVPAGSFASRAPASTLSSWRELK